MEPEQMVGTMLEDIQVPIRIKLSALWASVMCCYIYGDYFGLYQPGVLRTMLDGKMGPFGPTTQGILVGTSLMMAIPSVMIFLSLVVSPRVNRWLNIVLGVLYTVIILVTIQGAWVFLIVLGAIEMGLTGLIAWYAWHWPRQSYGYRHGGHDVATPPVS